MSHVIRWLIGAVASVGLVAGALSITASAADDKGQPKERPKIDCSKPANQKKAACKNKHKELNDDELFYAGYWLARKGDFKLALHYLDQAENKADPRILTYIGYANRKLGRWDEAMGFYRKALAADPDYSVARAYMGEAFLEKGDAAKARAELGEIEQRCGVACSEYGQLASEIAKFEARVRG